MWGWWRRTRRKSHVEFWKIINGWLLCFDLLTRPKMTFKVMHRKEMTHFNGSYERKSRGRKLARGKYFSKKSSCIFIIASVYLWGRNDAVDEYITDRWIVKEIERKIMCSVNFSLNNMKIEMASCCIRYIYQNIVKICWHSNV